MATDFRIVLTGLELAKKAAGRVKDIGDIALIAELKKRQR